MRFPNMGDEQNIEGRFLGLCSCDLLFESDTVLLLVTSWCNSCTVDASKRSDGLLFCSSVSRLSTKRGEAMKKLNIVGMGHGPCRLNAEYCIDMSLGNSHFVRKQGGVEV